MTLFIVREASFVLKNDVLHTSYQLRQPGYPLESMHNTFNIRMWLGWPTDAKIAKAQSVDLPQVPEGLRTGMGRCNEIIDGYMYSAGAVPTSGGPDNWTVQAYVDRMNLETFEVEAYDPQPFDVINTHPAVIVFDYWCIQDGYVYVTMRLGQWYGPDNDQGIPSSGTEIWRVPVDNNSAEWERVHSQGHGFLGGPDAKVLAKLPSGKLVFPSNPTAMWSDDGGATWTDAIPNDPAGIPGANIARVTPIQVGDKALYHSGTNFVALNDDLTYEVVAANVPSPSNDQGWQRLATDGENIIYVNGLGGIHMGTLDDSDWPDISGDLPEIGTFTYARAVAYDPVREEWYMTSEDTGEPHVYGFLPDLSEQTFSIQLDPVIGTGGQTADVIHMLPEEESDT